MKKIKSCLLGLVFLFSAPLWARSSQLKALVELENDRLVMAHYWLTKSENEALLNIVREKIQNHLQGLNLSAPERYYYLGALAWDEGHYLKARNNWYRFLSMVRLNRYSLDEHRVNEIQFFMKKVESIVRFERELRQSVPKKSQKKKRKKEAKTLKKIHPEISPLELQNQAELAYKNGQLEYALRLYTLAKGFLPDSEEIQNKLEIIQQQLN